MQDDEDDYRRIFVKNKFYDDVMLLIDNFTAPVKGINPCDRLWDMVEKIVEAAATAVAMTAAIDVAPDDVDEMMNENLLRMKELMLERYAEAREDIPKFEAIIADEQLARDLSQARKEVINAKVH